MQTQRRTGWSWVAIAAVAVLAGGCVERIAKIRTDPAGATVVINDEEVGVSPTRFAFTWYGDYDIILRKPGYRTLKTSFRVDPPWYQYPPIDVFAETLVPTTIRDEHELPVFTLEPDTPPTVEELVGRAVEIRENTLFTERESLAP